MIIFSISTTIHHWDQRVDCEPGWADLQLNLAGRAMLASWAFAGFENVRYDCSKIGRSGKNKVNFTPPNRVDFRAHTHCRAANSKRENLNDLKKIQRFRNSFLFEQRLHTHGLNYTSSKTYTTVEFALVTFFSVAWSRFGSFCVSTFVVAARRRRSATGALSGTLSEGRTLSRTSSDGDHASLFLCLHKNHSAEFRWCVCRGELQYAHATLSL